MFEGLRLALGLARSVPSPEKAALGTMLPVPQNITNGIQSPRRVLLSHSRQAQLKSTWVLVSLSVVLQSMLKRGVDTLKMENYQILYCEGGLATGAELESLQIMSSAEHFVRPQALCALLCGTAQLPCTAMPVWMHAGNLFHTFREGLNGVQDMLV